MLLAFQFNCGPFPSNLHTKYQRFPIASSSQILKVAVPTPLRRVFDYLPVVGTQAPVAGTRIRVPFGQRQVIGILLEITDGSTLPEKQLKLALEYLDSEPLFSAELFQALLWASDYYQHPVGDTFATALPKLIRTGSPIKQTGEIRYRALPPKQGLESQLARAPRQRELIETLASRGPLSMAEIRQAGFDRALLRQLEDKGLTETSVADRSEEKPYPDAMVSASPVRPNPEQIRALTAIEHDLGFQCSLLDGVTGSGKTEVYMQVMTKVLEAGKQCLLLVPEIGLTPQNLRRFEQRFNCPVVAMHSAMTDRDRLLAWRATRSGCAPIVIGTRSAIFLPLANPGIIIIDEEHDASFKQQEGLRYSARDFAIKRAQLENIPVVLGSATPSLESLNNALAGKFQHLKLSRRAGLASAPKMSLIDVASDPVSEGVSTALSVKIERHLQQGNQVLLFINRRGYAPILQCDRCRWYCKCHHCNANMTVHANPPSLRCHHCEARANIPSHCPHCKSDKIATLGTGTQKLELFLTKKYRPFPVLRIDRDSTRGREAFTQLTDKINQGEPSILLGTQMLAKGHHFPDVTLVAVLDADIGLFSPDFRGQEQMIQTIVQVAGRAGRANKVGEVVIQTRYAEHPGLNSLMTQSYEHCAKALLRERQLSRMPPFNHLCLLRIESSVLQQGVRFARHCFETAFRLQQLVQQIELIGPLPAPMEKKAGRFRFQLHIKSASRPRLQRFLQQLAMKIETGKTPSQVRWSLDVDAQDLL